MKLSTQEEKLRSELIGQIQPIERPDLLQEVREMLDRDETNADFRP